MKKILCVDDDKAVLDVIELTLESSDDYEVVTIDNGKIALAAILQIKPDAILLDMMMPGMTGTELFAEFKKISALKNIPVAFLTSATESEQLDKYMDMGAKGVIAKPIEVDTLIHQVNLLFGDRA